MVYITQWEEFAVSSERLCLSSPEKTRFSFKYRANDGVFVVKVTDDRTCLQYKSTQKSDLRKMEMLNMRLLGLMTSADTNVDAETSAQSSEAMTGN
ncbi:Signal recognition particle 9 kDa protein [Gracilariopsis chorda]|uniref:Signal recognition particle 9 kDa protein n=1 Tax=Gracilariopsis chorda TaxID=448386 RepID=A0A2V3J786_9FLOR|nr:Signal recognition particle 9 kDa protein [Gracilariopsis chorda]|eukprot:PXF49827.1 Signal recognition particle 9 kDa protein [Gracilariopsis chorda]